MLGRVLVNMIIIPAVILTLSNGIVNKSFANEERNMPTKESSFKKFWGLTPPIGIISSSNILYIKINNSCCSGFGINIFS